MSERKRAFLDRLKAKTNADGNITRYKRYLGSPLRYAGGKSALVGYIVERIPDTVQRLVSPFFGAGSAEIAVARELDIPVIGFDIFDILVNYWKVQIQSPIELCDELKKLRPDKETYAFVKNELKRHWKGQVALSDIKLAAYYYFNHNLSYGPGFLGWMSKVYANEEVYNRLLKRVCEFAVPNNNLQVFCASFEKVIPQYTGDFLYCDPPYYLGEDSTLFRGLYPQRNFPIHHNSFNHELLRDILLEHKGGFILSYNDSPTIRRWYSKFEIVEIPVHYTMGQGETRIGHNRKNKSSNHVKKTHELLIIG